jgi:hypothetical protein
MGPSSTERRWDILRYCDGAEIWTLNNAYQKFGHITGNVSRWFELHSWKYLKAWDSGVQDHFAKLDTLNVPVYVSEPLPLIRNQILVPWVDVFLRLHRTAANYFLGSPSLMMALALYEHDCGATVKEIRSYGIDTSDPQHKQQRQSWSYWCSQAQARGIELGGTAADYMTEPDMDAGLAGLREKIGDEIKKHIKAGE